MQPLAIFISVTFSQIANPFVITLVETHFVAILKSDSPVSAWSLKMSIYSRGHCKDLGHFFEHEVNCPGLSESISHMLMSMYL
jgi:hypothetical protein